MESAALVLAASGNIEEASIALGHLEAFRKPYEREANLGFRTRALELVDRDNPRAGKCKARGATMSRDQIVVDTIEYLGRTSEEL